MNNPRESKFDPLDRARLAAQLDDMELHEDTGDPRDEGYMAAINELREWLWAGTPE